MGDILSLLFSLLYLFVDLITKNIKVLKNDTLDALNWWYIT